MSGKLFSVSPIQAISARADTAFDFPSQCPQNRYSSLQANTHQWGRPGFDGDACGQEACRGARTRDRVQNDNCQSTDGIRSLIS